MKKPTPLWKCIVYTVASLLLVCSGAKAQQETDVIRNWISFSDAPNALYHHLAKQAYTFLDERAAKIKALHSLSDWQQRQQWIRNTFQETVGPFPAKTPLDAKIMRVVQKDGFRIEHLVYASRPRFYVTASLFIPDGLQKKQKAPAILYCSGHSDLGYRVAAYQQAILNLVKKGFIVLAFDPVGQGERLEYYDVATGKSKHKGPTTEHSYPGAQLFIAGSSLASYMIWDGIRAVDYLLTRKEVDPERIGITGRSGGGTQSAYIAAFDDRIKAAAPENYITNFTRLFQTVGPQDAEQNFFNGIARGLDMADLLLVRAPKPLLMITTTRDMFSIEGSIETAREVSSLYKAYDKTDHFSMVTDDAGHASTKKNREAMYAFFQHHLQQPGSAADETLPELSKEELQVTPSGQVSALRGETVFSLQAAATQKQLDKLTDARKQRATHLPAVITAAKKLSGYHAPSGMASPVFTGRLQKEGFAVEKAFVKGEGDYVVPYLLMIPEKPNHRAIICLYPSGKAGVTGNKQAEQFVHDGFTVLVPDLIGTGETGPGAFKGDSYIDGHSYNVWFASLLVGRSVTGIQAGDVTRLQRLLYQREGINEVCGYAEGAMAPVLLHAAAFDSAIARIALSSPAISYRSLVMQRYYDPTLIQNAVPGALQAYDLPDLAASLVPRPLLIIGADSTTELSVIKSAYNDRNAGDQLWISNLSNESQQRNEYNQWIKLKN